jgi:hypothetical protein
MGKGMRLDKKPKLAAVSPHYGFETWKAEVLGEIEKMLERHLQQLAAEVRRLADAEDVRLKRSEAGRKSASARREKFGSARPDVREQNGLVREQNSVEENFVREQNMASAELAQPEMPGIEAPVREQKPRKARSRKVVEAPPGSIVWGDYCAAFLARHGVEPIRDARANKHCSDLVKKVGPERARELAAYYVSRSDAQYLKSKHPLGILILDVQKLNTEMQTGQKMTNRDALRAETSASNEETIRQYLANPDNVYNDQEEKNAASKPV